MVGIVKANVDQSLIEADIDGQVLRAKCGGPSTPPSAAVGMTHHFVDEEFAAL